MGRFVEAANRDQASFLPACLEDYVDADNPVRIIDAFVDELDLAGLGCGASSRQRPLDPAAHRARCSSFMSMGICIS